MSKLTGLIKTLAQHHTKTAIIHKTSFRTFTHDFSSLCTSVKKMGALFAKHHIKKGDRVIIWGPNSPQWTCALLGCFLYGIIAVPVDIRHPKETVQRIKSHSGARLVMCPSSFPTLRATRINLEDLFFLLDDLKGLKRNPPTVSEQQLAEIVYTSGTTGTPKGVMITHSNIHSNIMQGHDRYALEDGTHMLTILPLSHLFGQLGGCLYPLLYGHTVIFTDVLKPSIIKECFSQFPVTVMPVVPKMLQSLASKLPFPKTLSSRLFFGRHFDFFVVGGAALDAPTENLFHSLGYGPYVGYGLTETSPVLTCNAPGHYTFQTAGIPVKNTSIKIAADGEVLAKGPQVFSGYYKNTKQTKESFRKGWFLTGDLGRIDEEGNLVLLGRKKDLIVTTAGVNVYPEDIETTLNKIPGVKDSCVIGIGPDGDQVHAALLLEPRTDPKQAITFANKHLDDTSRITSHSVWHDADFPRTPTAKIRKFIVKQSVESRGSKNHQQQEDALYQLIKRLTHKAIKESSTLESLGLSSLDRMELVSLLETHYHLDLDEDQFTPTLTVKQLRQLISNPTRPPRPSSWQHSKVINLFRRIFRRAMYLVLARPFVSLQVKGLPHLEQVDGPVIFIANHESHYDAPTLLWALPSRFSDHMALAAWKEYFESPHLLKRRGLSIIKFLAKLTHGIFLLPQSHGALTSLRHAGHLLDTNYHVLLFPEGGRTRSGKPLTFKPGIGILVKQTHATVVPVKLKGLFEILPSETFFPQRGSAQMIIGKPLTFTTESPIQITKTLQNEMRKL